jgi:ATP-dependent Clp protease protease subunit
VLAFTPPGGAPARQQILMPRTASPLALETAGGGGGGGGMVGGARIGPPPDMPSLLLNNRIVYLGMPISASVAELIVSELLYLNYDGGGKPVIMYINSPGTTTEDGQPVGFETEAFAIADTMSYVEAPIQTVCVGKAYGLAAMLLACGDKGKRSSLPYGTVMLHQPRGWTAQGQASDIALKAKEMLHNRKTALDIMSKATGVSVDKLSADTDRCLYLDPQGAKEYGIIDKIVEKVDRDISNFEKDVSSVSRGLG